MNQADQTFLKESRDRWAGRSGARQARAKLENTDVKSFADCMIRDHTKANHELTMIARWTWGRRGKGARPRARMEVSLT
ncbi:MAG: DUF4142 domain-containing protein [Stellaceae bacterium]